MAHLRFIAILVIAFVSYVTLIDTAAVRTEEFAEQLQRMALEVGPENLRTQRAIETGAEGKPKRKCYHNEPCGWAVYTQFTRQVSYYMRNTCDCPDESYKCVRIDDDLSQSAYVYRCRRNTTPDDIEWA